MASLLTDFSTAILARRAAVFIGAGLSKPAGLPGWNELIEDAAVLASVPSELSDAPLAAEYISGEIGETVLNRELLKKLVKPATPTELHRLLAELPLFDYWTTNYDNLLERAMTDTDQLYSRIVADAALETQVQVGSSKQLFKMHGSLNSAGNDWESPPVLTRSHFETYEADHPRFWAQLRAQFLTRSFLFLGLSFEDPNLNVLLRLARSLDRATPRAMHWAIMKQEGDPTKLKLQALRIADLRRAGIEVQLIDDYDAQDAILADIQTRTRNPNVFVAGSHLDADALSVAEQIATQLADDQQVALLSFGGEAAFAFSHAFKEALEPAEYRPERVRHYYRQGSEITLEERIGTAIFTDMELSEMRNYVIPKSRAMVVLGGGDRTLEEAELARSQNIAVVPVASTGGAAHELWTAHRDNPAALNLPVESTSRRWCRLVVPGTQSVQAALQILRASMFE
jgi:hypothetical protein